jgi:hypothetical protein
MLGQSPSQKKDRQLEIEEKRKSTLGLLAPCLMCERLSTETCSHFECGGVGRRKRSLGPRSSANMPPPTRCLLSSPRPSPVWLHSSLGSVKANFEDGDASRWAQDRSARSKNERRHSGTPSYVTIGLTAELRKDSSDEPLSCRIFHARWQHRGAGEPGGEGAISRSWTSRSAGSAGGIGAAYLVATTLSSVRGSGSSRRHSERPRA